MRANRKMKAMKKKGRTDSERPRKCLQDASQEEVPVAVTTAVALVAMGTSRTQKQTLVSKGKLTLSFLFSGKETRGGIISSNIHYTVHNLLVF